MNKRTPLQILQTLRAAIDEVGWAVERIHHASNRSASAPQDRPPPLGTDDLLPILSYIFVKARPSRLCSMLYYARAFQLTDTANSPELQWALVTCDAVIAYLRSDPLRLCRRRSSSSIVVETSRTSSQSQRGSDGTSDVLFARSMSSRSHHGSAAASSLQVTVPMTKSSSGPDDSHSTLDVTPPQSPRSPLLSLEAASDHLSVSGSNSFFLRQADVSSDHLNYAASETSPRMQAEGFKLPGLPASISSRRNSRILQQRPTSVFSMSEDGDAISLGQDTSLEGLDRRLSAAAAASQSPSRRMGMRGRTLSSSSSSATHNDVQIRPQIVRTIKRSQVGNMYGGSRLERTSSNGSTASSSQVHVRVVGSPSMGGRDSPLINASPPRSDRRRSFDSWTAFSLFSTNPVSSGETYASSARSVHSVTTGDKIQAQNGEEASSLLVHDKPAERAAASSGWLSWGTESLSGSRRNSVSVSVASSRGPSVTDVRIALSATLIGPEADNTNCQPGGVEAFPPPSFIRSHSSRASLSFPRPVDTSDAALTASLTSLPVSSKSKQRYRGRFLSTSSAAAPLPPQVDRSSTSSADLARPSRPAHRQSLGSLNALRATMNLGAAPADATTTASAVAPSMESGREVPDMIPKGHTENSPALQVADVAGAISTEENHAATPSALIPLLAQLNLPSPVVETDSSSLGTSVPPTPVPGDVRAVEREVLNDSRLAKLDSSLRLARAEERADLKHAGHA